MDPHTPNSSASHRDKDRTDRTSFPPGSESRWDAIFEASPDLYFWLRPDGVILEYRASSGANLYVAPEKFLGQRMQEVLPAAVAWEFEKAIEKVFESTTPVTFEYELPIAGDDRFFEARLLPYNTQQILVIVRDFTERKRAEEALAAEKRLLAVTLGSIGDGVIAVDMQGSIVLMNRIGEKLTGWSQEEAMGRAFSSVFRLSKQSNGRLSQDLIVEVLQMGELVDAETGSILESREDRETRISLRCSPLRDYEGRVVGVVSVFRDITHIEQLSEERMRASKLESIGMLAGGIAHDFNNILTALCGNLSLARRDVTEGHAVWKRLEAMDRASARARDLAGKLLTFAHGGLPIKKITVLGGLIRDATTLALHGSNVRSELHLAEDLWPVEVDPDQFEQVLNHLTLNAAQAMSQGGTIEVKASNLVTAESELKWTAGTRVVSISVRDQGVGISEDHLSKIFDPYFTTKKGGSGLGLAVCYSIVQKHGGHIRVGSKIGLGTTFEILLPACQEISTTVESPPVSDEAPVGHGRILIMDDEPFVREMAEVMLQQLGYTVELVPDGAEAVHRYSEAMKTGVPFDAVVMDLTIPGGMGGKEAIRLLRACDPQVRAIVSSGYSNDPILAHYQDYGFSGILPKPYRVQDLAVALREVLKSPRNYDI